MATIRPEDLHEPSSPYHDTPTSSTSPPSARIHTPLSTYSDGFEARTPSRTSAERSRHDRQVLEDEEEREKLLLAQRPQSGKDGASFFHGLGKKARRRGPGRYRDDKGELMYKTVEEGGARSTSSLSSTSDEDLVMPAPQEKVGRGEPRPRKKQSKIAKFCRYTCINVGIAIAFVVIAYGAYRATIEDHPKSQKVYMSNGTHEFAQTTILVSLDGFRADFLQRGLTPTLNGFIKEGVSPPYMLPSFPSVTFPNHYTLVTGLYPESHGVVGNTFWDPDLQEEFYYTHPSAMQPKWWHGEPLWVTAESQGVRTATHMWPGSEAHVGEFEPTFVDKYNGSEVLASKVDRILGLLDKPGPDMAHASRVVDDQRPQLIAAYVPNVDADGHVYGPNSTEIRTTITAVDDMLALLLAGLHARNLTTIVNVIVVSDHGMATTSTDRTIQFEDLVDPSLIEHIDGWPHYGLRPKDPAITDLLHDHLLAESAKRDGFDVYSKDTMPERYHFSNNPRIAPVWIIPHTGWAIVTHDEFNVSSARATGAVYHPRGIHGYDHEHPLMRAIFVARGPAFPHFPGSKVDVFQNTEVYNVLCDSVGVTPKANNGTLRLPFVTSGLHGEEIGVGIGAAAEELKSLADPPLTLTRSTATGPPTPFTTVPGWNSMAGSSMQSSEAKGTVSSPATTIPSSSTDTPHNPLNMNMTQPPFPSEQPTSSRPHTVEDHEDDDDNDVPQKDMISSWKDWFHDRIQDVKGWLDQTFKGKEGEANRAAVQAAVDESQGPDTANRG